MLYFRCWQRVGGGGGHLSKGQLPPTPPNKPEVTAFTDRVGGGVTCRNSTVSSNRHLQLVISGLTGVILAVTGTVNLQFWGAPVPMSLKSILRIVAAQVLDKVNCFT